MASRSFPHSNPLSQYLSISKHAVKAAADRCCYAGTDAPEFSQVDGYTEWQDTESGDLRCFKAK